MPASGYKSVTVSDDTYQLATQIANQEDVSITQVITEAVKRYFSKRIDEERVVKLAVKAVKAVEAGTE